MAENLPRFEEEARSGDRPYERRPGSPRLENKSDRLLIEAAEVLVRARTLPALFQELAPLIMSLTACDFLKFALYDPDQNCMITRCWKGSQECGQFDAFPVDECVSGWAWRHQEAVHILDVQSEKRFPHCVQELRKRGVRSYTVMPLSSGDRRFGALGLGKGIASGKDSAGLELFRQIADLIAQALGNLEGQRVAEQQRQRLQSLVTIGRELSSSLELEKLLPMILDSLRKVVTYDYAVVALLEEGSDCLRVYAADGVPELESLLRIGGRGPVAEATARQAMETRVATLWSAEDLDKFGTPIGRELHEFGIQSLCNVPLFSGSQMFGALNLGAFRRNAFHLDDSGFLQQIGHQVAAAIRNAEAYREVGQLRDRLAREKRYLETEIRTELHWDEIVGKSPALKRVLDYASIVAPTDSTVLITGETGTGKERIARAIHGMSRRKDRSFIKLNCAAIPTGLLESELFGHEKGAFTGAVSQKIGRLELADKGSLFLDEIGEIALELQPKLLRVLQDREFERLGGTRTIRVDTRLIAATNRDLAQAVAEKEFRSDLFYRLHVFPLHLPALRDRREDIPMLVHHFVEKSAVRLGRRVARVPQEAMDAMMQWDWPGNIRELENFIERSMILSDGPVLHAPLSELRQESARERSGSEGTLEDRERDHIIDVLRQTRGLLSGPRGAAARLGVKRTTLQYKLQRLGIARTQYTE